MSGTILFVPNNKDWLHRFFFACEAFLIYSLSILVKNIHLGKSCFVEVRHVDSFLLAIPLQHRLNSMGSMKLQECTWGRHPCTQRIGVQRYSAAQMLSVDVNCSRHLRSSRDVDTCRALIYNLRCKSYSSYLNFVTFHVATTKILSGFFCDRQNE